MNNRSYILGVTGISITLITSWFTLRESDEKSGIIWHDQGNAIRCERVDTHQEAVEYAEALAQFTDERFDNGSSYHYVVAGDWIMQMQPLKALSYHASGQNLPSIGVCIVRTDDHAFNLRSYQTAKLLLQEINANISIDFSLGHYHVARNGKEDPRPFGAWMEMEGLIWDSRPYPDRIEGLNVDPPSMLTP